MWCSLKWIPRKCAFRRLLFRIAHMLPSIQFNFVFCALWILAFLCRSLQDPRCSETAPVTGMKHHRRHHKNVNRAGEIFFTQPQAKLLSNFNVCQNSRMGHRHTRAAGQTGKKQEPGIPGGCTRVWADWMTLPANVSETRELPEHRISL